MFGNFFHHHSVDFLIKSNSHFQLHFNRHMSWVSFPIYNQLFNYLHDRRAREYREWRREVILKRFILFLLHPSFHTALFFLRYKSIFRVHFKCSIQDEGNLHNMNIFSPSMIRQLDSLIKEICSQRICIWLFNIVEVDGSWVEIEGEFLIYKKRKWNETFFYTLFII